MNRRGFLGLLAGFVADPERLLWVRGEKLISIPQPATTPLISAKFLEALFLEAMRRNLVLGGHNFYAMRDLQRNVNCINSLLLEGFDAIHAEASFVGYGTA